MKFRLHNMIEFRQGSSVLVSDYRKWAHRMLLFLRCALSFMCKFDKRIDSAFPTVLRIQPFSPTDIYTFLTRWPFSRSSRGKNIAQIYEELTTRPTLRDMCRNPLVLSMYVAEHESSDSFIPPESRTDFYLRVTNELLIRRRL